MGLFDSLRSFAASVEHEYDRRIKAASKVKAYDPTGASHHHGHVELHNEHVEQVSAHPGADEHAPVAEPTPQQQSAPREVTHH